MHSVSSDSHKASPISTVVFDVVIIDARVTVLLPVVKVPSTKIGE